MLVSIDHHGEVATDRDFAFAFVADHNRVPTWMFGISSFEPGGDRATGTGACFDAAFAGVWTLRIRFEATAWREGELIVLESAEAPFITVRIEFEDRGPEVTSIRMRVGYQLPGGLAARPLHKLNDLVARRAVRQVESTLRRQVESAFVAARRG